MKKRITFLILVILGIISTISFFRSFLISRYYIYRLCSYTYDDMGFKNYETAGRYYQKLATMKEKAMPILKAALFSERHMATISAIELLGNLNDPEANALLKKYMRVRLGHLCTEQVLLITTAEERIKNGDPDPIPFLIYMLDANITAFNGQRAFEILQKYTKKSFGYSSGLSKEERVKCIKQWWTWWKENYADRYNFAKDPDNISPVLKP